MWLFWPFRHKERAKTPVWERTPPSEPPVAFDEQGRRHRTDVPYLLPKDEQELQRLNYQHHLFRKILQGSNTLAPVDDLLKEGGNVLDVGCGSGRWGCEMATQYQKTRVIGLDIEDILRTPSMPLNYHFQRGNLLDGLPFETHHFQYVHQRLLVAGIPLNAWPFVVGELRRVTAVNGWVELAEMGTTFHDAGPATKQFLAWWAAISATRGIDASKVEGIGLLLEGAGFARVRTHTMLVPVGRWHGRLGDLLAKDILAGWPNVKSYAHTLLGISPEDFDAVINRLEDEWNTYQTHYAVYFACGHVEREHQWANVER
jgi:SAM-dependent methyltransferase